MNIATKNKIKPIVERKTKGNELTDSELQVLRAAALEAEDLEFKDLLQTACNETTPRLRRLAGKELLNKIGFATGARRENDLPPDNPRPQKAKRMLKSLALVLFGALATVLSGCATATAYKPAGSDGGYSETMYAPEIFRVHFNGNENTPVERSRDFALLRAADLTIQHGYRYFTVSDVTPPPSNFSPPPAAPSQNVQVNNYNYGDTYAYHTAASDNAAAAQGSREGLSNLANFIAAQKAANQQSRQSAQTELLVHCFVEQPLGVRVLDANFIAHSLREKYGIKEPLPLAEAPQQNRSQKAPLSGHYIGSGKSVENGVEQPYDITLDVFDSGEITFVCTAVVSNQQAIVTGKGKLDANGNVTVENEFGYIGHGTISGKILSAGGQNADGSTKSSFTAQKQE